jgi:hypothetical protein
MVKNKHEIPSSLKKTVGARPHGRDRAVVTRDVNKYKDSNFSWRIKKDYLCKPKNVCHGNCESNRETRNLCFSLYKLTLDEMFFIFEKLYSYEGWSWRQIERSDNNTSCGFMLIKDLDVCDMVRRHLNSLNFEDEYLYKIEISGRHRVWGIRRGNILYLLWNDKEHRFYKGNNTNYTNSKK